MPCCCSPFILVKPARADVITTTAGFSGLLGIAPGIQHFDPSLGTLDSINVSILGTLSGDIAASGPCDPTNGCVAIPYDVFVDQSFFGVAGQFFSFSSPARFQSTGQGVIGQVFPIATVFSYSFTFDNITDLFGGLTFPTFSGPITPPIFISGQRNDFLTPINPINGIDFLTTLVSDAGALSVTGLKSDGSISITYNFTPAPAPVPEPASLVLLGSVLTMLLLPFHTKRSQE